MAIIALIATPIILNIVNKARKSAFLDSAYGIIESAKLYYTESLLEGGMLQDKTFIFEGEVPDGLNYSGSSPKEGTLTITTEGTISLTIRDDNYCATKSASDSNIVISNYENGTCVDSDSPSGPAISVKGSSNMKLKVGESYTELGAIAKASDGSSLDYIVVITLNDEVVTSIESTVVGTIYVVTYTAIDGEETLTATRKVTIVDGTAPVITFAENPVTLKINEVNGYNIYTGVTVEDNIDGIIEANMNNVKTTGTLKSEVGEYKIIYTVTDSDGNQTTAERTFIVVSSEGPILNLSSMGSDDNWIEAATIKATISDNKNLKTFTYEIIKDNTSKGVENVTVSGKEAEVNISFSESGLYMIKLTGSNEGNGTSELSSGTYKVDVIEPVITASTGTVEVAQGEENDILSYFTIASPTTYSGTTTVCKDGTSSTSPVVTNTSSLDAGSHTIRCTVTRGSGKTAYADKTIAITANKGDNSGAEAPQIANGFIPIKWNGSSWIVADSSNPSGANQWYDYDNQMWANGAAVTTEYRDATIGTEIPESAILAYFVWIPRFEYQYTNLGTNYAGGSQTEPGAININLISKSTVLASSSDYKVHPAFNFGGVQLPGIWVGKFETTGTESNPTIKPNLKSLGSQKVSVQFSTAQKFSSNTSTYGISSSADAHMMKNSEWGAVAYLSQSKYGKYGNSSYSGTNKEIFQNKSTDYLTGCSYGSPSVSGGKECQYTYEIDIVGTGASTTGTIYGIYDMSGGLAEQVMGIYRGSDASSTWGANVSGYNDNNYAGFTAAPAAKYYNEYAVKVLEEDADDIVTPCSSGICYGHALDETSGWYGDNSKFSYKGRPWVIRGGIGSDSEIAGIFATDSTVGIGGTAFRVVLLGQ